MILDPDRPGRIQGRTGTQGKTDRKHDLAVLGFLPDRYDPVIGSVPADELECIHVQIPCTDPAAEAGKGWEDRAKGS